MPRRYLVDVSFVPWPAIVAEGYFMLASQLNDMVEPVKEIAEFISSELRENFDVEGRPPWEELAESTLEDKARLGYSNTKILEREGNLREEVADESRWDINRESHGASAVFTAGEYISAYGHFHLSGTSFMPVRDFLSMPESLEDEAEDKFSRWVDIQVAKF